MKCWGRLAPRWLALILKGDGMSEMIGFIGLGNMGQAMASSLLKAGYTLTVSNRTLTDTLPARSREVLPSSSPLAHLPPRRTTSRGGLSRSVFRILGGSRLPDGTGESHQKEYRESRAQDI